MTTIWVASDHHINHAKILTFVDGHDTPLRTFKDVDEMNETMVERHNAIVKPEDHVYFLGDFAMRQQDVIVWAKRFNGHKRLVRGNHDIFRTKTYMQAGFEEIYGVRILNDMIFSHIPLHPESVKQRWAGNVHGHLHTGRVPDPRYLNVSVEQIEYTPITLEEAKERLEKQQ